MLTLQDLFNERTDHPMGKFQKLADSFCASVRATAKQNNKWVSGDSASLLKCKVELNGNNLQAVCDMQGKYAQFWQLQTGRKEGGMPPINALYEWSKQRGISFTSDKERWSFAWALAKTIARQGTQQYVNNRLLNIFNNHWIRFQQNFNRYIDMFCEQLLEDEIIRIETTFKK